MTAIQRLTARVAEADEVERIRAKCLVLQREEELLDRLRQLDKKSEKKSLPKPRPKKKKDDSPWTPKRVTGREEEEVCLTVGEQNSWGLDEFSGRDRRNLRPRRRPRIITSSEKETGKSSGVHGPLRAPSSH